MPIPEAEGLSSSSTLDVSRSRDASLDATKDSFHPPANIRYSDDDTEIDNPLDSYLLGNHGSVRYHSQAGERRKWWKIYALHFLFMWNVRTYEYASIVLVALAFPKSLTATSIRGIASTVASMLCASAVGGRIDSANTKIRPLMFSISANHLSMMATYLVWMIWPTSDDQTPTNPSTLPFSSKMLFAVFLFLDVVEHLSAMANRLSIERDWIPSLVEPESIEMGYGLTQVNAVMKRVEVICKLVAPSLLPMIVSSVGSRAGWTMLLAISTVGIWILELCLAMNIARENKQLLATKAKRYFEISNVVEGGYSGSVRVSWLRKIYATIYLETAARLKLYFSMPVWPASIASALPEITVLAYSATLITYLLEIGFSLSVITIARGSGTILALGATFITPWAVEFLRRRGNKGQGAVRRVGFWAISSQFTMMIPVVLVLWNLSPASSNSNTTKSPHEMISIILFIFLSFTRVGHWSFELMIQEIEQVEIPAACRSTFAGTEQSFHSLASLCHWAATVVWNRPEDFRWLAVGSLIMIGTGATIYGSWSRRSKPSSSEVSYSVVSLDDISDERRG